MKRISTTVTCDHPGCDATITVTGPTHAAIIRGLADHGWPNLRSRLDLCPDHAPGEAP